MIGGYDIPVGADTFKTRKVYEVDRNLIATISNLWDTTSISTYAYGNDAIGRRTNRIDSGASVATNAFGYNTRSELIDAVMSTNVYSYAYDPIGNRLSASSAPPREISYLSNELNQYTNIIAAVTNSPTYDQDGNMLMHGSWTYTWNGENRLITASNQTIVITHAYDYMGRRFQKIVGTTTNRYLYDGWALIRETDGLDTNSYVYGLDLSGSIQGAGTIGGLLSAELDGTTVFYCYDANGNVTELAGTSGATVAKYVYGPFGGTLLADDTDSSGTVDDNPFRFSSKHLDDSTGWYYYGYRYYSPELGRWPSRDPIGEAGGENLYVTVANSPIGGIDILGYLLSYSSGTLTYPTFVASTQSGAATLSDYWTQALLYTALVPLGAGDPLSPGNLEAAQLLAHYLGGSGTMKTVPFGDLIDEASVPGSLTSVREDRSIDLIHAIETMRTLPAGAFKSSWGYVPMLSGGWHRAINGHRYAIDGSIFTPSSSGHLTGDLEFQLYDEYKFSSTPGSIFVAILGVSVLSNYDAYLLHKHGLAKEFEVRGTSETTKVDWRNPPSTGLGTVQKNEIRSSWRASRTRKIWLCGDDYVQVDLSL